MKILLALIVVAVSLSLVTTFNEDFSSDESDDSSDESPECKIRYQFTLWIGDNIDEVHSLKLESECEIVFFDTMQQASQSKDQFLFEHTMHPLYGALITKIAGVANDDDAYV